MPIVSGVRLRYSKTLWFDPADAAPVAGDVVIVSTQRGEEVGVVSSDPIEVEEAALSAPLKPVIRVATEADLERAVELGEREKEAMPIFRELIAKHRLEIKPIDVDFLFGGDKITFYFVSDDRVDFRNLVKDLASRFHQRIDMRQVGPRDEARMVGGIGHCGEELCCHRMGGEFQPVSIKMAKAQGLSLNPVKISGQCGRLMCCLRYEAEAYQDFNARSPRKGAMIKTSRGEAKVTYVDALREIITMRFQTQEGGTVAVPLAKMSCNKGAGCPCSVDEDVLVEIDEAATKHADKMFSSFAAPLRDSERVVSNGPEAAGQGETSGRSARRGLLKTGSDKNAGKGAVSDDSADAGSSADKGDGSKRSRRSRRGRGKGAKGAEGQAVQTPAKQGAEGGSGAGSGGGQGDGAGKKRSRRGGRKRGGSGTGAEQRSAGSSSGRSESGASRPPIAAPVDTRVPRRRKRTEE